MSDAPAPGAPDRDSGLYQPPPVLGVSAPSTPERDMYQPPQGVSEKTRFSFLNAMMAKKPRWEHDCPDCTWLGPAGDYDLYACIKGYGPDNLEISTVIARSGPEGEYQSGLGFTDKIPALGTAFSRAQDYVLQVRVNALRAKLYATPLVEIDAFNLWVGATFMLHSKVYIVHSFMDYGASERVLVETHRGDEAFEIDGPVYPFLFDYMDKVAIIGNVRNPQDFDDNNWGNN